ncbi:toll/interleukin-1 receptor domain-containing protein [Pectobacterium versatile]|uniref:toll/interleukin-1 receptor domain-containing protein n=1 Tax=Pectobacterium versatile TaxID=2488639 RepID=UPI0038661A7A
MSNTDSVKRILTVGLKYSGKQLKNVEIDNLGLCNSSVDEEHAAYALYDYDVIIINPQSYTHFLFGEKGKYSEDIDELSKLKKERNSYDIDTLFHSEDREKELLAAISAGTTVIWCLSEPKKVNFFGYRQTSDGYAAPAVAKIVRRGNLLVKKGRKMGSIDPNSPFEQYFESLKKSGWRLCLEDIDNDVFSSIASTPEGYSLGGRISLGGVSGWLLSPPSSETSANQLILDAIKIQKENPHHEKYDGIFLSHTSKDKPFVRRLRKDLLEHGVPKVWVDEAEIEVGDSLTAKIEEGMKETRYIGVVLSSESINAPWVKKELDIAINREISSNEVVVLPLLYQECDIPPFLQGKLYADFTSIEAYENGLEKLLRKLRVK